MNNVITAEKIEPTGEALVLHFMESVVRIPWNVCGATLAGASEDERRHAQLSPGGYGIHWTLLDLDLSIAGLLRDHRARMAQG
jgi:Protein of unknown function (DUF2442)